MGGVVFACVIRSCRLVHSLLQLASTGASTASSHGKLRNRIVERVTAAPALQTTISESATPFAIMQAAWTRRQRFTRVKHTRPPHTRHAMAAR
jgi:hypothetical protein